VGRNARKKKQTLLFVVKVLGVKSDALCYFLCCRLSMTGTLMSFLGARFSSQAEPGFSTLMSRPGYG